MHTHTHTPESRVPVELVLTAVGRAKRKLSQDTPPVFLPLWCTQDHGQHLVVIETGIQAAVHTVRPEEGEACI